MTSKNKIIYEWEIPKDYSKNPMRDDIPESYRVLKIPEATNGIMIEAKYNNKWCSNPWNLRTLIKHLVEENNLYLSMLSEIKK